MISKSEYEILKSNVLKLEKEYGYEPEYKYKLIDKSFQFEDFDFFKEELSILVKNYGFQVTFMNENESYYHSIMFGELSKWFKKMYLKNHLYWLKHNFEKQVDLRKLNEIEIKNQCVNKFSGKISLIPSLDSIEKVQLLSKLSDYFYSNVEEIHVVSNKINSYPTGKSFALIQNSFGIAEIHNYQFEKNFIKGWDLMYPFYKKSYINDETTYMHFRNHDNFFYLHYGYQVFGLINIDGVPEYYRKNNDPIPIKDKEFLESFKKEVNWEN